MVRLDSLDITLDTGTLPRVDRERLTLSERTDPHTGEVHTAHTVRGRDTGLHGFNGLAATDTTVSFRLTAQVCGDAYSDGISNATLDAVCERINGTGLVEVTPAQLRDGTVRRADPFADVPTDGLDVPGAIRLIGRTSGQATHVKGRGEAVTLYHALPDRQGQLRCYGKDTQLQKAKHAAFRALYPAAVERIAGHHRFEVETQHYHAARRLAAMATGTPTLADVLDSPRTPVADAIDALLSTWSGRRRALLSLPTIPQSLDAMLSRPTTAARDDAFALLATLYADLCHGDYQAAQAAVRARYGQKNAHRLYSLLQAACESHGRPAGSDDPHAEAYDVLATMAARVREREQAR